jgi:hypothetical protein
MTSFLVAPRAHGLFARSVVAGHAAFKIELRLGGVIPTLERGPAGLEVSGGQDIHAAMARVAEIALVMADRTRQIGKVRVLSVP